MHFIFYDHSYIQEKMMIFGYNLTMGFRKNTIYLSGAFFLVFIFGMLGSQQAMAGNEGSSGNIVVDKSIFEGSTAGTELDPELFEEGDAVTFTIRVDFDDSSGGGEASVSSIMMNDLLPDGLTYVSDLPGGRPLSSDYVPDTGNWEIFGLVDGEFSTLSILSTVDAGTCGSTIENEASLVAFTDGSCTGGECNDPTTDDVDSVFIKIVGDVEDEDTECPKAPEPISQCTMFAGIARSSDSGPGSIGPGTLVQVTPGEDGWAFVGPGVSGDNDLGISGLAINSFGNMFATTVEGSGTPSSLVQLDPVTGLVINDIGTITLDGDGIKVKDLSFQPGSGILYGIVDIGLEDGLITIDINTAEATLVGFLPSIDQSWGALAFAPDGTLYATFRGDVGIGMATLSPNDAEVLSEVDLDLFMDGLAVSPCDGTIYGDTGGETGETIYEIDFDTGEIVESSAANADAGDLAFIQLPRSGGSTGHEPPTIGKALDGVRQVVDCGISIDGQCRTVTSNYHEEMELLQMLTSPHTISNTIFCDKGVEYCNYIAVGFMGLTDDFNNPLMTVSASKDHSGDWTLGWYDPDDYIADPSDPVTGDIVFVPQIIDNKLLGTSFTIDFKNKDTGQLKMGIQVRDSYNGVRNFYFNEGVEFIDEDAYPAVVALYDAPIEVEPLCFGQNNADRNSCAFAKIKDWATENAEEALRQMTNGQYQYEQ